MSDIITLAAETRDRAGKGASRALRREGRVPAVIYGAGHLAGPESVQAQLAKGGLKAARVKY